MKRWIVFAHYDKQCIIDDYVIYYLKELKKNSTNIVFVSDCDLPQEELNKLKDITDNAIAKHHGEYDWGSYKIGFKFIEENINLEDIDELVFCNDSVYGPIYPLQPYINKMSESEFDFTGFLENKFEPKGEKSKHHIQSWFILFKKQVFSSDIFKEFMHSVKKEDSKEQIIIKYEIGCSELLSQKFSFQGLVSTEKYDAIYSSPFDLIKYGFPFCKVSTVTKYNILYLVGKKNKNLVHLIKKHQKRCKKRNIFINCIRYLKYDYKRKNIKIDYLRIKDLRYKN